MALIDSDKLRSQSRSRFARYLKNLDLKGRLLDVGSGNVPEKYFDLLKTDKSIKLVGIDITFLKTVDVVCDANYMPFKNCSFDNIFCMSVLQYSGYAKVVEEISRVMKKHAVVHFTVPNAEFARCKKPFRTIIKKMILRRKDTVEVWADKAYNYDQIKRFHKYGRKTFKRLLDKNNLKTLEIKPWERRFFPQHWLITAKKI